MSAHACDATSDPAQPLPAIPTDGALVAAAYLGTKFEFPSPEDSGEPMKADYLCDAGTGMSGDTAYLMPRR